MPAFSSKSDVVRAIDPSWSSWSHCVRRETSSDIRPRIGYQLAVVHVVDCLCAFTPSIHQAIQQEVGCTCQRSCKSDPLIISAVFCAYRLVYQSPCLCSRFHHVHALVSVATVNGRHCWGCFRRLIRFHNVYVIVFPFTCVFPLGTHRVERTCCDCGLWRKLHHCWASSRTDCRFRVLDIDPIL